MQVSRQSSFVTALEALREDPRVKRLLRALGDEAQLHIVGGTVRDAYLGKTNADIDLASAFPPEILTERLLKQGIKLIPTGLKHQTVTTVPLEGLPGIEITSFRGPHLSPLGGAIVSSSIDEDLKYRDFTINAMAYCLSTSRFLDPQRGMSDLEQKLLRAVGNARERFVEDPLRTLRLVRFATTLDLVPDRETFSAAQASILGLEQVSVERIRDEFNKTLLAHSPKAGIQLLLDLKAMKYIIPEILTFVGFEQNAYHTADLLTHTLEVLQKTSPILSLRLAALLHDVGKPPSLTVDKQSGDRHFYRHEIIGAGMAKKILKRLKYSNEIVEAVCTLVATHMRPLDAGPGGMRRLLRDTSELFPLWRELKYCDASSCKINIDTLQQRLEKFDQDIAKIQQGPELSPLSSLAITGQDLLEAGLKEGPIIGEILRALHERVLDSPELNEKQTLLPLANKIYALKN